MAILRHVASLTILPALLSVSTGLFAEQDIGLGSLSKELEKVVKKIRPSVVGVKVIRREANQSKGDSGATIPASTSRTLLKCSGIVLTRYGEIATLFSEGLPEVEEGVTLDFEVTISSGEIYPAIWKATDPPTGVTLLEIVGAPKLRPVRMVREVTLGEGALVLALGAHQPLQLGQVGSVERGVRKRENGKTVFFFPRTIRTNLSAYPGDVGGILADAAGKMVGMLAFAEETLQGQVPFPGSARGIHASRASFEGTPPLETQKAQGKVCAIPADLLAPILSQLRGQGRVIRGYLGVTLGHKICKVGEYEVNFKGAAAPILEIHPGPAADAGLQQGDWLITVDGLRLKTRANVDRFIERIQYGNLIGKTIDIYFVRFSKKYGSVYRTVKVTVTPSRISTPPK